jgi:hypothetical protein
MKKMDSKKRSKLLAMLATQQAIILLTTNDKEFNNIVQDNKWITLRKLMTQTTQAALNILDICYIFIKDIEDEAIRKASKAADSPKDPSEPF